MKLSIIVLLLLVCVQCNANRVQSDVNRGARLLLRSNMESVESKFHSTNQNDMSDKRRGLVSHEENETIELAEGISLGKENLHAVIEVVGASYIKVLIDRLKIPRNVELIVYSGEESYTYTDVNNGRNIPVFSVDGEKVELELVGEVDRLKARHEVLVSQYWTDFGATQESICGQVDYKDAECFKDSHPTVYDRRRAIGRLRPTGCTVWRISSDNRFMTNNHCIGSNNGIQNQEVVYNYQRDGCNSNRNENTVKVGLKELLKTSSNLDFTLFTVMEPERLRQFGWTGLDISAPDVGKEIYLIHHPRGLPKKITFEDDFSTNGRCVIKSSDSRSLFYTCDSEPGSSGSCMFSESSRRAIGLHKWGGCTGRGNGATRVDKIWPEISEFFNNVVPAGDWEDGNNQPGVWGKWSNWSDCDATCGEGKQKRTRKCDSGNCVGPNSDSQSCKSDKDCGKTGFLKEQKYLGYFSDSLKFFDTATKSGSETLTKRIYKKSEGENYSYQWWGFICPTKSGNYQFRTNSDDGSFVYVNNKMVVNNGGLHGPRIRSGSVSLSTGCQEIHIYFGEKTGGDVMDFQFQLPGENVWKKDLTEIFSPTKDAQVQFDPCSTLVTYVDQGSCGCRGDDAKADLSQCEAGSTLIAEKPNVNWQAVATIDGCTYYSYKIYSCKNKPADSCAAGKVRVSGTAVSSGFDLNVLTKVGEGQSTTVSCPSPLNGNIEVTCGNKKLSVKKNGCTIRDNNYSIVFDGFKCSKGYELTKNAGECLVAFKEATGKNIGSARPNSANYLAIRPPACHYKGNTLWFNSNKDSEASASFGDYMICVKSSTEPVCGNGVCENGEVESFCFQDCKAEFTEKICTAAKSEKLCDEKCPALSFRFPDLYAAGICGGVFETKDTYVDFCESKGLSCPSTKPVWSNWGSWSSCDNNCGQGTKTRKRTCKTSGCLGDASLVEVCVGSACPSFIPPTGCECASVDQRFGSDKFNTCDVDPLDNKAKCYVKKPCLTSIIKEPHFVSCIDTKKVAGTNSGRKTFKDYVVVTEGVCPKGSERIAFTSECKSALQFVAGFSSDTSFKVVDNLTKPTGCSYNMEGEKWTLFYNLNPKSIKAATSSNMIICTIV